MVEVEIDSIRVSLMSQQRIVILKERNSERFLPIWIGPYEAEAITLSLQEVEVTRPLTHDLLRNILQELGAEMKQVNITSLQDDVFYARIILTMDGREMSIDSRPSDAIALAVRAHIPVFIAEDVMNEAASTPEKNIEGEEIEGEPDERLDVFKDFVETLNLDDLETTEDDDKE
ncbi:MAG: bifunctional nuclease family protein [Anaerolineales bacterium]|nr:bifunctional nuclease family protein [Anaerolineales bacterium]